MGNCWPSERARSEPALPILDQPRPHVLRVDQHNALFLSYRSPAPGLFEKRVYDWKGIPIISELDFRGVSYFQVRPRSVKDSNFLVGILKKSALTMQLALPWKSQYCICYESHDRKGESGIIFAGTITKAGDGVRAGETIRVLVSEQSIQFQVEGRNIGRLAIPAGFLNDQIVPYVALFNSGDCVQLLGQVQQVEQLQQG